MAKHHHHRDRTYPDLPEPLAVPVYDDHTHIDPPAEGESRFAELAAPLEPAEQLRRAEAAGVRGIVQVGTEPVSDRWSAELADSDPRVLAAVALHPNFVVETVRRGELDAVLAEVAELTHRPRVRAVGETGLDFHYAEPGSSQAREERELQIRSFEAHIAIAREAGVAVQIHDRDAHRDVVDTLLRVGSPSQTVFHCFSGDVELARICNEHGWCMSFAGNVTFPSAANLRRALVVADPSLILVETDAPYMAPVPNRGRPNAPYQIPWTLRAMAEVRGQQVDSLARNVAANAERVYGPW